MSEEAPKYFAVLTDVGAELEARALQEGKGIVLTHIAVGDANLQPVIPEPSVTELVHEVYRCAIDSRSRDEADKKVMLLHATIPADVGGWWIYELGVMAHLEGEEEEVLYAYANHARYYKVLPQEGQSLVHTLTVPIVQCTDANIIINILDEGYATIEQLRAFQNAVNVREAERAGEFIRLTDRVTKHELSGTDPRQITPGSGSSQMSPAGYTIGEARVAPVSIVSNTDAAPAGAALVLHVEEAYHA